MTDKRAVLCCVVVVEANAPCLVVDWTVNVTEILKPNLSGVGRHRQCKSRQHRDQAVNRSFNERHLNPPQGIANPGERRQNRSSIDIDDIGAKTGARHMSFGEFMATVNPSEVVRQRRNSFLSRGRPAKSPWSADEQSSVSIASAVGALPPAACTWQQLQTAFAKACRHCDLRGLRVRSRRVARVTHHNLAPCIQWSRPMCRMTAARRTH